MYNDYMDVITERLFDPTHQIKSGRKIPKGRKRVAYTKLFMGLFYLGIFATFGPGYNYCTILEPWFGEMGYWRRFGAAQVYGVVERTKYYAIWTLTEVISMFLPLSVQVIHIYFVVGRIHPHRSRILRVLTNRQINMERSSQRRRAQHRVRTEFQGVA